MRRFHGSCIITSDVARLRAFYRAVLEIEPEGDGDFVAFPAPGAGLSIYHIEATEAMAPGSMAGAGTRSVAPHFSSAPRPKGLAER